MSGVPLLPSVPTLLVCASLGVPTVVEQQLDGGADVEIVDQVSHRGSCPCRLGIAVGWIVQTVLTLAVLQTRSTALHRAVHGGHGDVVNLLLRRRCDPNRQDVVGARWGPLRGR